LPPAVVIRLEFERSLLVYADCLDDGEEARPTVWLTEAHPEYGELAALAMELAERARAA
jgi:hypothetical protein